MSNRNGYSIGRFAGRNISKIILGAVAIVAAIYLIPNDEPPITAPADMQADICKAAMPGKLQRAKNHAMREAYQDAIFELRACAIKLNDPAITTKLREYESAADLQTANSISTATAERLAAVTRLIEQQTTQSAPLVALRNKIQQTLDREQQAARREEQRQAALEAARKRREGVRIGMTQEDVLASSWGKPRDINRTVNRWGTREQWVYPGGYLYFEDGILTTVQH